jgi:hypothetical protein
MLCSLVFSFGVGKKRYIPADIVRVGRRRSRNVAMLHLGVLKFDRSIIVEILKCGLPERDIEPLPTFRPYAASAL